MASYGEAASITIYESGAVRLSISDEKIVNDPALVGALQHIEAAADALKKRKGAKK